MSKRRVLCVVNYEPVSAYARLGMSNSTLDRYYNPVGYFDEVHVVAYTDRDWRISDRVMVHGAERPNFLGTVVSVARDSGAIAMRNFEAFWTHLVTLRAAAILDVPCAVSLHDVLWPRTVTMYDQVFTYVGWQKQNIEDTYGYATVTHLPNRIDEDLFSPGEIRSEEVRRLGGSPRIVQVGRVEFLDKNVDTMLRAVASLKAKHPDIRIVFVGDGPDRPRAEQLADELGLQQNAVFVGNRSEEQVADFLRWSDFHALVNGSGDLGRSIVEALMAGNPVVAAGGRGSSLEDLEEGVNARMVPVDRYRSVERVAEALRWMIANNRSLDRGEIRRRAVDKYGYDRLAGLEASTYDAMISRYASSPRRTLDRRIRRALKASAHASTRGGMAPLSLVRQAAETGWVWGSDVVRTGGGRG